MFSWSNKDAPSGTRRTTGSKQYTHQQHITSYLTDPILKPSTRKVNDSTYDTVFQTKDHNALILRVHFPQSPASLPAPKMTLVGIRAVHPWIDSKMRVIGYDRIKSDAAFVTSGILLATAVNEVVRHFQLNPPQQLVVVDAGLRRLQESLQQQSQQPQHPMGHVPPTATSGNRNGSDNHATHMHGNANSLQQRQGTSPNPQPQRQEYTLPPHFRQVLVLSHEDQQQLEATIRNLDIQSVPTYFKQFDSMDRKTMTEMIDSPSLLLQKGGLKHHPLVEEMQALKLTMMEANSHQATSNLKQEKQLIDLYNNVKELQSTLKSKMEQLNQLQRRQMELCKPMDKKKILQRLKKAKKESFDESEELANEWIKSGAGAVESNVDHFVDRFLEIRTVHHVRAAKMERLALS